MPRHEFEQAQRQLRLHVQDVWGAEVDALPMHREVGVRHSRTPVAELREGELNWASLDSSARMAAR